MKILTFLFLLSMTLFVQAQGFHGYVENENKEAIIGAKVSCGNLLIASDWNGRFELINPTSDTVIISYKGFEAQLILLSKLPKKFIH